MKPCYRSASLLRAIIALITLIGAGLPRAHAEPQTLRRVVELAVAHSTTTAAAVADQTRAYQSYREARNTYLPQVVLGSGIGYSYGFPLSIEGSAPAIFNISSQQFLLNLSQSQFVRAAKTQWTASGYSLKDKREQVTLDAATTYIQLDNALAQLKLLQENESEALRLIDIVQKRVAAGIDAKLEITRANLAEARVRMRLAEIQGNVDLLRQHLADLTGLPANGIETSTESIPALPEIAQQEDLVSKAVDTSNAMKMANQNALAKEYTAKGEHKALYPSIDLAGQYAVLSKFNNYEEFFQPGSFKRNNVTYGFALRLPFLNPAQRSRAQAADADAVRARKDADAVRSQVSFETLKLQRSVQQLAAARDVANYDYQLAEADLQTVAARVQAGTATLRDQENARLAVNDKYTAFLDASLELDKVRLQLLRATGELENWVGR